MVQVFQGCCPLFLEDILQEVPIDELKLEKSFPLLPKGSVEELSLSRTSTTSPRECFCTFYDSFLKPFPRFYSSNHSRCNNTKTKWTKTDNGKGLSLPQKNQSLTAPRNQIRLREPLLWTWNGKRVKSSNRPKARQ